MGPVTIAVDSYGPVTDNAQSVYELSTIETISGIKEDVKKKFGFEPNFDRAKEFLEENDGAGNTFKATAKPVLIGTAVVGATNPYFRHHRICLPTVLKKTWKRFRCFIRRSCSASFRAAR
jgi:K(+)-stimulated pyrophosphate-energized sodium pump